MRNNNNSEYRHAGMSRTSQAVVLIKVVALQIRYHILTGTAEIVRDNFFQKRPIANQLGIILRLLMQGFLTQPWELWRTQLSEPLPILLLAS